MPVGRSALPAADRTGSGVVEPWRIETTFAVTALLFLAPAPQSMALSILDLATSLVDHGNVVLDEFAGTDVAVRDGRILSGMPPGASFLAAALYLPVRPLLRGLPPGSVLPALYVLCTLLLGIPAAVFTVRLVYLLTRRWGATRRDALLTAALLGFGTMWFGYTTGFYKKSLAAASLMGAFWLLSAPEGARSARRLVPAGALCGLALGLDYPTALIVAVLTGYLVQRRPGPCGLLAFLAAAGLALLPTLLYHQAAFGAPWLTAYRFRIEPAGNVLGAPRLSPFLFLLATLVASSPCLLWSGTGWWRAVRTAERRPEMLAIAASVLGTLGIVSGWSSVYPHEASFASRLLLPALPFAVLPMAFGLPRRLGALAWMVISWSVGASLLAAQATMIPTATVPPVYAAKVLATSWGTGPFFSETLASWLGLPTLHLAIARGGIRFRTLLEPGNRALLVTLLIGQALVKLISVAVSGVALGILWQYVWRPVIEARAAASPRRAHDLEMAS